MMMSVPSPRLKISLVGSDQPVICGLIGYGALARQLIAAFENENISWVLLGRNGVRALPSHIRQVSELEKLIAARPHIVVEVASQQAVADYVPRLLRAGIDVIVASLGSLADPMLAQEIELARQKKGAKLVIPSGSIGGLDYLEAVACLPDVIVRYTSRKPVAAWKKELAELGCEGKTGEVVLFEGTAEAAAQLYPKNLNAAFAIKLAIGAAKLNVRVIADAQAQGNTHEIEVISAAGTGQWHFVNAPSPDNPKSSYVTALSLAASLRRHLSEQGGR